MKKTEILIVVFAILALLVATFMTLKDTKNPMLTDQEKLAMEKLPGYFFVFEGKTNHIEHARTHKALLDQHPMMPYLEMVVDRLEKRSWAKYYAIRIQETETQIVITLPSQAERLGMTGPGVFHAGYNLQVIIDKKLKKIISAVQG